MLGKFLNLVLLFVAFVLFLAILNAWGPIPALLNIIIALVALKFIGWLGIRIEVNIWSLLIVLIGGIPGLLILIFLSVTGLAFGQKKESKK
ncbi:hypothetical protein GF318_01955 [Candidatus Micrarchaeota archaeon]|nr:hypothetical protein [Candidatus Micrarchaeota archaeon]